MYVFLNKYVSQVVYHCPIRKMNYEKLNVISKQLLFLTHFTLKSSPEFSLVFKIFGVPKTIFLIILFFNNMVIWWNSVYLEYWQWKTQLLKFYFFNTHRKTKKHLSLFSFNSYFRKWTKLDVDFFSCHPHLSVSPTSQSEALQIQI